MSYLNINNLKQYIPGANIYGIIDNGGSRPNIIPDYALDEILYPGSE